MKSIQRMTQAELAAYIQEHLLTKGIQVILSGGAAVSVYSVNEYVSADIDLVARYSAARKQIKEAMSEIGFTERNRYFVHPDSKHIVEFPPGPLAVGDEPIKEIKEIRLTTGILRIISPTECVKDRLAAYYYWSDQQSLAQAVLVSVHNRIDMNEVKTWLRRVCRVSEDYTAQAKRQEAALLNLY